MTEKRIGKTHGVIFSDLGRVAERAVIMGDPNRVDIIANALLENRDIINTQRDYKAYAGTYTNSEGKKTEVTIATHQIGGVSASLVVEDLAMAGTKAVIRLGSVEARREGMKAGDIVVATEGLYTSSGVISAHAATGSKLATSADKDLVRALRDAASRTGSVYYTGSVYSNQLFYQGNVPPQFSKKVIAVEMELADVLATANLRGLKAAGVFIVNEVSVEYDEHKNYFEFEPMLSGKLYSVVQSSLQDQGSYSDARNISDEAKIIAGRIALDAVTSVSISDFETMPLVLDDKWYSRG